VVLGLLGGSALVYALAGLGGALGVAVAGGGWHRPGWSVAAVLELLGGGPASVWPGHQTAATAGISVVVPVVLVVLVVAALAAWARWGAHPAGFAGARDLRSLNAKNMGKRARSLRPSLTDVKHLTDDARGLYLGRLGRWGPTLWASWEDVIVAVMAPRAGKSTTLAVPMGLAAPGPLVLTSNKNDVYTVTKRRRAKVGRVWKLDPQNITHDTPDLWWDILAEARTPEGARRLAGHFLASAADSNKRGDFWFSAATNLLKSLFHAAALSGATVADVLAWLSTPADRGPVDALRANGRTTMANQLASLVAGAADTRDGVYETARQCVDCLSDPAIERWVTPNATLPQFEPRRFVRSRDTLYLFSKDGGGSASGLIAAAADAVMQAGMRAAERDGGRLDPPMVCVLDEAANICRIEDLPDLYSHLGSRGIIPVTILQSYRQGERVWGDIGMAALWSAATVKLLGAGLDDADFGDRVSRLIGERRVNETSVSHGGSGRSVSTTMRRERIMDTAQVRAMPKGTALLLATGVPIGLIRLQPWYRTKAREHLALAAKAETHAIAKRASQDDEW